MLAREWQQTEGLERLEGVISLIAFPDVNKAPSRHLLRLACRAIRTSN